MAARKAKAPAHALAPALEALGAEHRKAVAAAIGAARATPAAIGAVLTDAEALASIAAGLGDDAGGLLTQIAFRNADAWPVGARGIEPEVAHELERHGLLLVFESHWSATVCAPAELELPLRHIRARAHAAAMPDGALSAKTRVVHVAEQLLHDAAVLAAVIGGGGIQVKADGGLFARAGPRLTGALAVLPLGMPGLEPTRVDLALRLLEENGALRVRAQELPGGTAKRELALARDIAAMLDVPGPQRAALMDAIQNRSSSGVEMAGVLLDACAGRTLALEHVGAALTGLFDEAAKQLPGHAAGAPASVIGLAAVTERWLRGDLGLAVDAQGVPVAVVFAPAAGEEPTGPPCVAQGDFELVAMRPVTPGERAALLSVAEAVPGREHVARITKARLHAALRADHDLDVGARLKQLAGTLPQNVEETVLGWVAQAPKRVRLCSAMMIVAPEETTGDRLAFALGTAMVRRLSPTLLAVAADDLSAVVLAAKQTGVVLEEGLDRISGTWTERPGREAHAAWWRPTSPPGDRPRGAPHGRLVSRLDWTPEAANTQDGRGPRSSRAAQMLARRLAAAGLDPDEFDFGALEGLIGDEDEDEEVTVEDLVLDAYDRGRVLRLKYAGAAGLRQEWVTVQAVEDARVKVRDHATGKHSWRWLRAIEEAQIVN